MAPDLSPLMHNLAELLSYHKEAPMIFSSGTFWGLFILFLPLYALLKRRRWQMIVFVAAFSLYFYYKSSGWFFVLLIFTSTIDWCLTRAMARVERQGLRKLFALVSILCSLGILAYFKYSNFFLWNWAAIVRGNFQPLDIILPVGISFYTFQSISYVVDVYKRRIPPADTWLEYLFFLSFFPALVAGPIVRADYFMPQVKENRPPLKKEVYAGLWLVLLGVVKKAIIADYISQYNDLIFSSPTGYGGVENLMGVLGYAMQIYCDFSGYSDMAIGIAMIMGFKLSKNFDFPYKSANLTQFWRTWHISLSSWLRDYLYIPLGGNRRGTARTYLNSFLTMLIGGLWHGAAWKFVFWGGMHGVGLAIHKALKKPLSRVEDTWIVKALSVAVTFSFVSLLWVFFRADDFGDAWKIISRIFTDFHPWQLIPFVKARALWCVMTAAIIVAHALPREWHRKASELFVASPWLLKLVLFLAVVQLVVEFMGEDVMPFIYFQF